jgi:hypothetical protein
LGQVRKNSSKSMVSLQKSFLKIICRSQSM